MFSLQYFFTFLMTETFQPILILSQFLTCCFQSISQFTRFWFGYIFLSFSEEKPLITYHVCIDFDYEDKFSIRCLWDSIPVVYYCLHKITLNIALALFFLLYKSAISSWWCIKIIYAGFLLLHTVYVIYIDLIVSCNVYVNTYL